MIQRLARQLSENDTRRPFAEAALPADVDLRLGDPMEIVRSNGAVLSSGDDLLPPVEPADNEPLFYKVSEDSDFEERMRIRNEAEKARLRVMKDFGDAEDLMEAQRRLRRQQQSWCRHLVSVRG